LTSIFDLDLQSQASYGHDPYTKKTLVQKSVGSKDEVETNGRTDERTEGRQRLFNFPANTVGNK